MKVRALALAVSLALVCSAVAEAQELSSEEQQARAIFEAGRTAYEAGRFEQALRYFDESYELSQRPALLFNIASAADRLQMNERALASYRAYLEAVPDANNRELAESRIRFLERATTVATPAEAAATVASPTGGALRDEPSSGGGGDILGEAWFWTVIAVLVVGVAAGVTAGVVVGTSGVQEPLPGDVPVFTALGER
jgi:tetratricopeptide (TPR) repeat protein